MKTILGFVGLLFLAIVPTSAWSEVLRCVGEMSAIKDEWLHEAVTELKREYPHIAFQHDDQPCQHAKETVSALTRTFGRNHLKSLTGYEFVKVIDGEEYFTVERFESRKAEDLQALSTALQDHPSRKLKIEANTSYEYFLAGHSIVLMISSATGRNKNSGMFCMVRRKFSALAVQK